MSEKNRAAILEHMKSRNNTCADCGASNPEWASASKGLFICITCSGIHRNLGAQVSVVKSLRLDTWTDEKLKLMEEHGNDKGNAIWARNVPLCYRRPKPTDPHVLREQWIRAKYERKEFIDGAPQPNYLTEENSLAYFIKDQDREPKCTFNVTEINVTFAEERTSKENSLQITYVSEGLTRNYFVYSDSGKEIVDWYMAIRNAKLNLLGYNKPGINSEKLDRVLTRDFIMEGFLDKTGPRDEPWQKRWFTLDGRRLLYLEKPMDPHAKGELIIGSHMEGFALQEGVKSGKHQDDDYCFTLITPWKRDFVLKANTENERRMWMDSLSKVIARPMTDEDKEEMKLTREATKKIKKKTSLRYFRRVSFTSRDEDSP
ncbi:ArfGAP with dual PH [Desmophyllum pertusum]|uniref:ArfGAP with dual PH n=1 Tax=Desmophyllum pertusum TaxID=174260 RepID=A0A9W9Z7P7_9CNID|nr:ArfGAP with dual PH [Desmophyllum pertusum]